ncbi:Crp/Fnr family transcriptional regulator [Variovorax sp. RT4R15]|uniref:Crp/Fnr family transcriptional regulator n=1 Tax=Variovorax sp. RT4R15 TaxID=3443737 RepID=UPI003F484242
MLDHVSFATALAARFGDMAASDIAALAAHGRCVTLARNQTLLAAGTFWREAFWVERGLLRLYYIDRDGREANKNFHAEDAFLWPVTEWLRRAPAAFFMAALEPSRVWCLPFAALDAAAAPLPSWTALQLRALSGLLEDKMRREQNFLQCTARERYEALLRERPEWTNRIALRHLASYLGMTDVSLSRLRAEMGLIDG